VLALSAFCTLGFSASALWSLAESFVYGRHHGSKWLLDILESYWSRHVHSKLPSWPIRFTRSVIFTISTVLGRSVDGVHFLWKRFTTIANENTLPHAMPRLPKLPKIPTFSILMPEGNADEKDRQKPWAISVSSFNIKDDGELAPQFWRSSSKDPPVRLVVRKAKGTSNLIR